MNLSCIYISLLFICSLYVIIDLLSNFWKSAVFGDVFINFYNFSANIWMSVLPCWLAQIRNRSHNYTFKYSFTQKYVQYVAGKRERKNEWERYWKKGQHARGEVRFMAENKMTNLPTIRFAKASYWWVFSRFKFLIAVSNFYCNLLKFLKQILKDAEEGYCWKTQLADKKNLGRTILELLMSFGWSSFNII